jgi:hypothetical protein
MRITGGCPYLSPSLFKPKGLHAITAAVPFTPNATGVPYLAAAVLLHEIGGIPSDKLAASIALAVALTNVVFWLSAAIAATAFRRSE